MKLEKVFIDKKCLVIRFDNGFEYDPPLWDTAQAWWIGHMRAKNWWNQEIEDEVRMTLRPINREKEKNS